MPVPKESFEVHILRYGPKEEAGLFGVAIVPPIVVGPDFLSEVDTAYDVLHNRAIHEPQSTIPEGCGVDDIKQEGGLVSTHSTNQKTIVEGRGGLTLGGDTDAASHFLGNAVCAVLRRCGDEATLITEG